MKHRRHKHTEQSLHSSNDIIAESSYDSYQVMNGHMQEKTELTDFPAVDIMKKAKKILKINEKGEIEDAEEHRREAKRVHISFSDLNYIGIGYNLVIPLLLGVFLGLFLDRILKTSNNFFTAFFIVVGLVSSLYNLFKLTKKENAAH